MNISLTSTFTPMTFAEFMEPVKEYMTEYKEMLDKYENLIDMTETWKDIATRENNPESYALYRSYADQLNAAAIDFSQGMTPLNRGNFLGLKRDYYRNIEPIKKADEARKEYVKYVEESMAKDPSAFFKNGIDVNVDSFLHGKTVSKEYDTGTNVMNRVSTKVLRLASSILSNPEFTKVMDDYAWQIKQGGGLTPEQLMAIINNNIDNSNFSEDLKKQLHQIRNIYDEEMNMVKDWTPEARAKKEGFVKTGMYAGLQAPTYQFMDNKGKMSAAEQDASARGWALIALSRELLALLKAASRGGGGGGGRHSRSSSKSSGASTDNTYSENDPYAADYSGGIMVFEPTEIGNGGKTAYFSSKNRNKVKYEMNYGKDINFDGTIPQSWSSIDEKVLNYLKSFGVDPSKNTIRMGLDPKTGRLVVQQTSRGNKKKK